MAPKSSSMSTSSNRTVFIEASSDMKVHPTREVAATTCSSSGSSPRSMACRHNLVSGPDVTSKAPWVLEEMALERRRIRIRSSLISLDCPGEPLVIIRASLPGR